MSEIEVNLRGLKRELIFRVHTCNVLVAGPGLRSVSPHRNSRTPRVVYTTFYALDRCDVKKKAIETTFSMLN